LPLHHKPAPRRWKDSHRTLRWSGRGRLPVLALALLALAGCAAPGYYAQAVHGQISLMLARQPVAEVLAAPETAEETRRALTLASDARNFAHRELGLPDNGSYRSYVDLRRPHVVWNVFAAPPYSLELRSSCFLLVGCLTYRGYFSEVAARRHAERLRARGEDVFVGGVSAYSTLGWFADPLLSSMLRWDESTLVRTLFHELAHQWLYVPGDTMFNESFAMTVAEAGLVRWWHARHPGAPLPEDFAHEEAFVALVLEYREHLSHLYSSALPEPSRRKRKDEILAALRGDFARSARDWPEMADYSRWLEQDLNNAKLASVAAYHVWVPSFRALLARSQGDLSRFRDAAADIGTLPPAARENALRALAAELR